MWATYSSPVRELTSRSGTRELVPLNRISFIRPWPLSSLSYMRTYEWPASAEPACGRLAT